MIWSAPARRRFCSRVRTGSGSDRIKLGSNDDRDPVATAPGSDTFELLRQSGVKPPHSK